MSDSIALSADVPSRFRRRGRRAPALVVIPSILTAAIVAIPLLYIFRRGFERGLDAYLALVLSAATAELLVDTMLLVGGVVTVSLAIAIPMAWLVARTDVPMRRFLAVAGALPLVFPSYIAAFTLVAVAGPRGYLQGWVQRFGVERIPEVAYGYSGAVLALAPFIYPYVYLLVIATLRRLDPALEESAQSLGMGRWRTFFHVVLPQLRPALYSGSLLVALYTLSDFGAVSIVRYNTFTMSIYNAYRALFDRTEAAALSSVLVAVTVALILVEVLLLRRVKATTVRPTRPPQRIPLGRWRYPALSFLAIVFTVSLVIPLGTIAYWLIRGVTSGRAVDVLSQPVIGSLSSSVVAALIAVFLAIFPAVWTVRYPSAFARTVERLIHGGYALPGIVVALALVFFVSRNLYPLYQTFALLVLAYVVRFLPEAVAATRSALLAIAPAFEEVAQSLGRKPAAVMVEVTAPMLRHGLLAGGGLVFLTSMKELPATLILRPMGFETLATRIWTAASEAYYSEAAVYALLLIAFSAVPVYLLVIRPALAVRENET
ncbi:MAG TPA: iron ABC transporter permease [Thermoanaerobaculia bacterium]|nr:iron ABC transporter permease [Thermoanaerobaculia bacterium]